jgi:hypothetical protein
MGDDEGWVPQACPLPTAEQPLRVRAFDELFAETLVGVDRVSPTRLRLRLVVGEQVAARARDLTARESECCSFFAFAVTVDGERVEVDVTVPAIQVPVLDALAARAVRAAT